MSEIVVEIDNRRPSPKWYVNFADFANMVKAFIGSNYLSIAFAFHQSGLGLGIIGIAIIAGLTDHCCHLLAHTKHQAIEKLVEKKTSGRGARRRTSYSSYNSNNQRDSGLEDELGESNEDDETTLVAESVAENDEDSFHVVDKEELREHMFKHMTYGDLGKLTYGSKGVGVVNFCIALTQFGFCVAYFIFIGNTVHSLFPVQDCRYNGTHLIDCHHIEGSEEETPGVGLSSHYRGYSQVEYDVYATADPNITTIDPNVTTIFPNTTTTPFPFTDKRISDAPDLRILVAAPLPIFMFFAFIRGVRYLGVISVIANASILIGCVSVLLFLVIGFSIHGTVVWFNFEGFPVFFGMVTAAFEGIGLVIPIESSMEGNRNLFPAFLHGALFCLTTILASFGILGYLRFGTAVHQMLNTNIPQSDPAAMAVNIGICIGILLTFPLQIFPVIQITELYLFSEGKLCGPKKTEKEEEVESLMGNDKAPLLGDDVGVAQHVPASVPTWKRNILRLVIVCIAGGLAVLLRDNFAYVGAFVGAIGSSVLAYILPCLFHMKICWSDLHPFIKVKDIAVVVFGVIASIVSLVSVIIRIANNTLNE